MEQLQILHEIIAAEQSARATVTAARREKADFDRNLESLRRQLEAEAVARAKEDVETARAEELSRVQSELEQLRAAHAEDLRALEGRFQAGRDEWAEKIFRMVVGLDDQ